MKLAEDFSDAPSKENAGLLGPISLADLSPDLRKIVEPMKGGELTPAIRTPRGYQVFKVESFTRAQAMPFEQAADQIKDRVVTGKRKDEFDKYLAKLRSQAIIEWKNPDVQKAYDDGLEEQSNQAQTGVPGRGFETSAAEPQPLHSGTRSGRDPGTNRSFASNSSEGSSKRFCRRSPGGAAGRTGRRRSTGRCFPATASRASIPSIRCRS